MIKTKPKISLKEIKELRAKYGVDSKYLKKTAKLSAQKKKEYLKAKSEARWKGF